MHSNDADLRVRSALAVCGALALSISSSACGDAAPPPTPGAENDPSALSLAQTCAQKTVVDAAPARGSSPVLTARRAGVLDLFYSGTNATARHRSFDRARGAWSGEEDLGGVVAGKPGAAAEYFLTTGSDNLDAFIATPDHKLSRRQWYAQEGWVPLGAWDLAEKGAPTTWLRAPGSPSSARGGETLPGVQKTPVPTPVAVVDSSVAAASWGADRLDLVYVGTDRQLHHRAGTGAGWAADVNAGGALTGDPAAVSPRANRIDVVARNRADNQLWHAYFDGTWHSEAPLGGNLASSPAITSRGPNALDVFWRDPSNALKHRAWNNGWGAEEDMGVDPIAGDPAVVSADGYRIDVVVEDAATHALVHRSWLDTNGRLVAAGCADTTVPAPASQCDFGLVAWSQGAPSKSYTCSGGVEYTKFNTGCHSMVPPDGTPGANKYSPAYCARTDINESVYVGKQCSFADYAPLMNQTAPRPYTTRTEEQCVEFNGKPKGLCTTKTFYDADPNQPCSKVVQGIVDGYRNDPLKLGTNVTATRIADSVEVGKPVCKYDLANVPTIHRDVRDAARCGGSEWIDDAVAPKVHAWAGCADSGYAEKRVHGDKTCVSGCAAVLDDDTCGSVTSPTAFDTNYSSIPGGSSHLDTTHTSCLTDENNAIDPASPATSVNLKFVRLKANLARARSGQVRGVDGSALARRIIVEMKLLFETYGDSLAPAQQTEVANLYTDNPSSDETPACGASFVPPTNPSCGYDPAVMATLRNKMAFCARLTSSHVSPQVKDLDVVKYGCIGLGTTISKLRAPFIAAGGEDDGSQWAVTTPTTQVSDAADTCGFKSYRAAYDTWVTMPLGARMNDPRDPRVTADRPELQMRLYLMDRWYGAIEAMYPYLRAEPSAAAVRLAAWTHAQDMEASLWRGVYRNLFPAAPVTPTPGGTIDAGTVIDSGGAPRASVTELNADALAALTRDSLQADHDLLNLAFTSFDKAPDGVGVIPLRTAPLLMVVADAFEGMSHRMQDVGIYHDMGCAYVGCSKGVDSEITHMVELLSVVSSKSDLDAAIAIAKNAKDARGNDLVRADWRDVYSNISTSHTALEDALKDAQSGDASWTYAANQQFLENGGLAELPAPARHLAGIIQGMRARNGTYKATGLFNPGARNRLSAGIHQDDLQQLRTDLGSFSSSLKSQVASYKGDVSALTAAVIQEMGLKAQTTRSSDALNQQLFQIFNLSNDVVGLANSLELNEKALGEVTASYASGTAIDPEAIVQSSMLPGGRFNLTAADARASGPNPPDVSAVATKTFKNVAKGTLLTVDVGGGDRWSPSCALQMLKLPDPSSGNPTTIATDRQIGPEGYLVTYSEGTFHAIKNDTADATTVDHHNSLSLKACFANENSAGFKLLGSGATVKNTLEGCAESGAAFVASHADSKVKSEGEEMRTTASFVTGMHVSNTPFPTAPVGALLAVVTQANAPKVVREVRVVQSPATTLILEENSDVYLVVNDVAAPSCVLDTSHALGVTVSAAVHAASAFAWLDKGIGNVVATIKHLGGEDGVLTPEAGTLVAQGRLLPEQEATIRSQAMIELVRECKAATTDVALCDPQRLPESARNFISSSVDMAITRIALKVQIVALRREIGSIMLQLQSTVDDYNASSESGRVAELLPKWTLRNLDTETLRAKTAQLVDLVTYDLYPVLALRYAKLMPTIPVDQVLGPALMTLVNAKWDAPVADLAAAVVAGAEQLMTSTQNIKRDLPPLEPKTVALSFPAPGKVATNWLHADAVRSAMAWSQAQTGDHVATFRIIPEDLYRKNGGPSPLLCTQEVPVVRDFAVVVAGGTLDTPDEDDINKRFFSLRSTTSPTLTFATATTFDANKNVFSSGGPLSFEIAADWTALDTQVIVSAHPVDAMTRYKTLRGDATRNLNGRGLSPFTSFDVDFSSLYDPGHFPANPRGAIKSVLGKADQIVLILDLEYQTVAPERSMRWITTCQ